jgi:hypothetical protein
MQGGQLLGPNMYDGRQSAVASNDKQEKKFPILIKFNWIGPKQSIFRFEKIDFLKNQFFLVHH